MWRMLVPLFVCALLVACTPPVVLPTDDEPFAAEPAGESVDMMPMAPDASATGVTLGAVAHRVSPGGLLEIGPSSAPHTFLLFVTPGSTYSERYVTFLLPRIMKTFVAKGTLKVQIAFVEFQKYPGAGDALRQVLCAAEQGAGTEALSTLIAAPGAYANAAPSGMTKAQLQECAGSEATGVLAAQNLALARTLGITLVPTAFLDGQRQTGLPEEADLNAWIRAVTVR